MRPEEQARHRASGVTGVVLAAVAVAAVGLGLGGHGRTGSAAAAGKTSSVRILEPSYGDTACAGATTLAAKVRGSRQPSWKYATGGAGLKVVRSSRLFVDSVGGGLIWRNWNTSHLPPGEVRLRATLPHGGGDSTRFTNDQPPVSGSIRSSYDSGSGVTTLSLPEAFDPDGSISSVHWYLGDGTTATGPSVMHTYAPGDYVVMAKVRDDHRCVTTEIGDESTPPAGSGTTELPNVQYCDPIGISHTIEGPTDESWPDRQKTYGWGPGHVHAGFVHNAKTAAGYLFEARIHVYGNPNLCYSGQVWKGSFLRETRRGRRQTTGTSTWTDDGYHRDNEVRRSTPSKLGDGTADITWVDMPSVLRGEAPKNAEIHLEFFDYAEGNGPDPPFSGEPEGGPGETAWVHFEVCSSWKPPAGTRTHSFKTIGAGGPDAKRPPATIKPRKGEAGPWRAPAAGHARFTGCGKR